MSPPGYTSTSTPTSSLLLLQRSIVKGRQRGDASTNKNTLIPTVERVVNLPHGSGVNPPAEGGALCVYNIGNDSLDNAESQWIDGVLGIASAVTALSAAAGGGVSGA